MSLFKDPVNGYDETIWFPNAVREHTSAKLFIANPGKVTLAE
jgi:hypothetical protein